MSTDITEFQGGPQRHRAREMSLQRSQPPTQVPGYEPERFLGLGAYGEVWVAVERNTGRRVAIKFYAHRGGLDWSLLSREVEKLAFLFADRYVVQLLAVGWDAEPPYYVMEYLERGSLADRLQQGPLPAEEALSLFHDVAMGLVHAHSKGVLHCDLKPANILLDQDHRPRLADFGQSRLSNEQAPALGTLFYMAPEQADLSAAPDARWDVYALGALLYCMLTGNAPHRAGEFVSELEQTSELSDRLAKYREYLEHAPPPVGHRKVRGVDHLLAEIIDRCLAIDPQRRYPNVQAILDALRQRARRRQRLPLMVLGAVGPAVLLAVVAYFAWQGFNTALSGTNNALTMRALESNAFAAQYVARTTADELERRYAMVEQLARAPALREQLAAFVSTPRMRELMARLSDPATDPQERARLREQFLRDPQRLALRTLFTEVIDEASRPLGAGDTASWFLCDAAGLSTVRVPDEETVGKNYAWRSFFHGGPHDQPPQWRPAAGAHLEGTTLSAVFRSQATSRWVVAVATPIFDLSPERKFLGVVAVTSEVGQFVELRHGDEQFAVLVDGREGENKGVILQHPLYDRLLAREGRLPDRFHTYRLANEEVPSENHAERQRSYHDPLAADAEGAEFNRQWLARMEPVRVRGKDTGWIVVVQESHEMAIGATLARLRQGLVRYGMLGLLLIVCLMVGMWLLASRLSARRV